MVAEPLQSVLTLHSLNEIAVAMVRPLLPALASLIGAVPAPPTLRICDTFPDVPLQDQFARSWRFHRDFIQTGRALIINTMYTTCRGSCPGTSSVLASLRKQLYPVFGKQLTILSLTLEPQLDTVETLHEYARRFGAGEPASSLADWLFLRAEEQELLALRRALGFFDLNPRVDRDVSQHGSLLLVGNPTTDRWSKFPAELRTTVLLQSIRRIAGFNFEQKFGIPAS